MGGFSSKKETEACYVPYNENVVGMHCQYGRKCDIEDCKLDHSDLYYASLTGLMIWESIIMDQIERELCREREAEAALVDNY